MYSQGLLTGQGLTLGEALKTGATTTVLGLSIVFSVLIILMIVLALFKVIFYRAPKKEIKPVTTAVSVNETAQEDTDEDELIAVLAAAVAASLNTSTYNLRIKSYRRTDNKTPSWNKAGLNETINNRF